MGSSTFLGSWMVLDGMCGVDYLETRPDVDASILGLSGCSGGGTNSAWLWALDHVHDGSTNCFVTTWLRNLENRCLQIGDRQASWAPGSRSRTCWRPPT